MTHRPALTRHLRQLAALCCAIAMSAPLFAADLVVTRYFSGLWDQPKQENQGIVLQIVDSDPAAKKAVAAAATAGGRAVVKMKPEAVQRIASHK